MSAKQLTPEQVQKLVDAISDLTIESIKAIPGEAGDIADLVASTIKAKLQTADLNGDIKPVAILKAAASIGSVIASQTPSTKDDVAMAKVEHFLSDFEENGEKVVLALLTTLFKKFNPEHKAEE